MKDRPARRYSRTSKIGLTTRPKVYVSGQPRERGSHQVVLWWRYGTKEEVLEPQYAASSTDLGWSESKIRIGGIPEVELAIAE